MRRAIGFLGIFLVLVGVSGTIDHVFHQPFFGFVLNSFNRWVVPNVGFMAGHPVFANLTLAGLGAIVAVGAYRSRS